MNRIYRNAIRAIVYAILASLTIYGAYFATRYVTYSIYEHKIIQDVRVIIPNGSGNVEIAHLLAQKDIINDWMIFYGLAQFNNLARHRYIVAGEYLFIADSTMLDVLNTLLAGNIIIHKITIPEGMPTPPLVALLADTDGVVDDIQNNIMEPKSFLPDTYFFTYGTKASSILNIAENAMNAFLEDAWGKRDMAIDGIIANKYEAIILASIIEREAKLNDEKPRIAAVFLNRLKIKMPLQADPTVIFAITNGQSFALKLKRSDLKYDSIYNTYVNRGLPPHPICHPGKDAIKAVLHPLWTNELYFVVNKLGGHAFSATYDEHLRNVRNYIQASEIDAMSRDVIPK